MSGPKDQDKEKIRLPSKIGLAAMALIICLVERGTSTLIDLIELRSSNERTLGSLIEKILAQKNFFDYYQALKNLKDNSLKTILWRLQKKGLVERKQNRYRLTKQGLNFIKKFQEKNLEKQWDGKWRIVMFDIPEKEHAKRNWLRYQLLNLEYKSLQKSVFIGKWPLDEDLFKKIFKQNIRPYIKLITVGEIDDDTNL